MIADPQTVLAFWRSAGPEKWFKKDTAFDDDIRRRFLETYEAVAAGQLAGWEQSAENALALAIVLDQFPRNMFRGSPRAFGTDPKALMLARGMVDRGMDLALQHRQRPFIYLPFEHSEQLADQERSVGLFAAHGDANALKYAVAHHAIIARFGRFPHRNAALGRASTPEEIAFLETPGSSF